MDYPLQRERRRFDMGRVVERTFGVLGAHLAPFLLMALVLVAVPSALVALGAQRFVTDLEAGGTAEGWLVMVGGILVSVVCAYLLQAAVVHASVEDMRGRSAGIGKSLRVAVSHIVPLVVMALISALGVMIGFMLLVFPGILLAVCWSVMVPARVVVRRGIFQSMGRSFDLTEGSRWAILLLVVVYAVVAWILSMIFALIGVALGGLGAGTMLVEVVISPLVSAFTSVISAVGVAAMYFELRAIKEGVAHENLAAVFE